jgi:hypothetical protein
MDRYNYYREQLESVSGREPEYPRAFQIKDNGNKTNWLGLNDESASELVRYLMAHYKVDVPTDR